MSSEQPKVGGYKKINPDQLPSDVKTYIYNMVQGLFPDVNISTQVVLTDVYRQIVSGTNYLISLCQRDLHLAYASNASNPNYCNQIYIAKLYQPLPIQGRPQSIQLIEIEQQY